MIWYSILADGEEIERLLYPELGDYQKRDKLWDYVTRQGLRSISGFEMEKYEHV